MRLGNLYYITGFVVIVAACSCPRLRYRRLRAFRRPESAMRLERLEEEYDAEEEEKEDDADDTERDRRLLLPLLSSRPRGGGRLSELRDLLLDDPDELDRELPELSRRRLFLARRLAIALSSCDDELEEDDDDDDEELDPEESLEELLLRDLRRRFFGGLLFLASVLSSFLSRFVSFSFALSNASRSLTSCCRCLSCSSLSNATPSL